MVKYCRKYSFLHRINIRKIRTPKRAGRRNDEMSSARTGSPSSYHCDYVNALSLCKCAAVHLKLRTYERFVSSLPSWLNVGRGWEGSFVISTNNAVFYPRESLEPLRSEREKERKNPGFYISAQSFGRRKEKSDKKFLSLLSTWSLVSTDTCIVLVALYTIYNRIRVVQSRYSGLFLERVYAIDASKYDYVTYVGSIIKHRS